VVLILFTLASILLDMGFARATRLNNQSVADLAGLAAGRKLPGDPQGACTEAWQYVLTNLADLPNGPPSPSMPCSSFPVTCSPDPIVTPPDVQYTASDTGPYAITFIYPVATLVYGSRGAVWDGTNPCERMEIVVSRVRDTFFARVIGTASTTATATATVRGQVKIKNELVAALLLLDPTGCQALDVGSDKVTVNVEGIKSQPGFISVDSDGSKKSGTNPCGNSNDYTIEANNTAAKDKIKASPSEDGLTPGIIALFALPPGATACLDGSVNHACEPNDVLSGRINPQPTFLERATRSIVDHTFNCKDSYPDYQNILKLAKCDNVVKDANGNGIPESAYIDELRYALGPGKDLVARGWRKYTIDPAIPLPLDQKKRCNTPPDLVLPVGNWWIDCKGPGVSGLNTNRALTFLGGNVVFEGDLTLGSDAVLISNPGSPPALGNPANLPAACLTVLCPEQFSNNHAFMYFRGDDAVFSKGGQSQISINRTAVIIENGRIDIAAADGVLNWSCPAEGPLKKLSLWSESNKSHDLGGQALINLVGVFFTPEARPFRFTGQGSQDQTNAQFITFRLTVDGNGILQMKPDPENSIPRKIIKVFLIR
jgi:hypothetical protein